MAFNELERVCVLGTLIILIHKGFFPFTSQGTIPGWDNLFYMIESIPPFVRAYNDDYNTVNKRQQALSFWNSRRAISRIADHRQSRGRTVTYLILSSLLRPFCTLLNSHKRQRQTDLIFGRRTLDFNWPSGQVQSRSNSH
jgi:hypothetical protein